MTRKMGTLHPLQSDFILKNKTKSFDVTIKLHPKEKIKKYSNYFGKVKFLKTKNLNYISKNYSIIFGMTSMLLIELGIYRNDIMSIILNSKKLFFGSKLGLTKNIDSKKRFKYYLKNKPKNNNKKFIDNIKSIKVDTDNLLTKVKKKFKVSQISIKWKN